MYDPDSDKVEFLADLTEICGEKKIKAIAQGKSHVRFYESNGKLYFSTHVGFYEMIDGMERLAENPPYGYKLYPGGHILSYDLNNGDFEDLAIAPEGEAGIPGDDYRVLCRSMFVDHRDGAVYFSASEGDIFMYSPDSKSLNRVGGIDMRIDYFGEYDPTDPGSKEYS